MIAGSSRGEEAAVLSEAALLVQAEVAARPMEGWFLFVTCSLLLVFVDVRACMQLRPYGTPELTQGTTDCGGPSSCRYVHRGVMNGLGSPMVGGPPLTALSRVTRAWHQKQNIS